MTCRKAYLLTKLSALRSDRKTVTEQLAYWLQVNRHIDGRSFTQAFIWNVRNYHYDTLQESNKGNPQGAEA